MLHVIITNGTLQVDHFHSCNHLYKQDDFKDLNHFLFLPVKAYFRFNLFEVPKRRVFVVVF